MLTAAPLDPRQTAPAAYASKQCLYWLHAGEVPQPILSANLLCAGNEHTSTVQHT